MCPLHASAFSRDLTALHTDLCTVRRLIILDSASYIIHSYKVEQVGVKYALLLLDIPIATLLFRSEPTMPFIWLTEEERNSVMGLN